MKYLELVNQKIRDAVSQPDNLVLFGQNISAGSCLGGLTKGLKVKDNSLIINSTNSENSLCGFGFGMMINDVSSIFFVKQLDFLILGLDHLVNTYNIIRSTNLDNNASFTIMPIIMDSGFQGPQASFNNISDMCSLARIPNYLITTNWEIDRILSNSLISPGFRIIGVSQRLFNQELICPESLISTNSENTVFQYADGSDVTIVCFNFSFPQGFDLYNFLLEKNVKSSLFNVITSTPTNWDEILNSVVKTKKLIILDDSKSQNLPCYSLLAENSLSDIQKIVLKKNIGNDWLYPISDLMEIDFEKIYHDFFSN